MLQDIPATNMCSISTRKKRIRIFSRIRKGVETGLLLWDLQSGLIICCEHWFRFSLILMLLPRFLLLCGWCSFCLCLPLKWHYLFACLFERLKFLEIYIITSNTVVTKLYTQPRRGTKFASFWSHKIIQHGLKKLQQKYGRGAKKIHSIKLP